MGPLVAGPLVAGPLSTVPLIAGPLVAGSIVAGLLVAGPLVARPLEGALTKVGETLWLTALGRYRNERPVVRPLVAGPILAGPLLAGPLLTGPLVAGPLVADPLDAGKWGLCDDQKHRKGHRFPIALDIRSGCDNTVNDVQCCKAMSFGNKKTP